MGCGVKESSGVGVKESTGQVQYVDLPGPLGSVEVSDPGRHII